MHQPPRPSGAISASSPAPRSATAIRSTGSAPDPRWLSRQMAKQMTRQVTVRNALRPVPVPLRDAMPSLECGVLHALACGAGGGRLAQAHRPVSRWMGTASLERQLVLPPGKPRFPGRALPQGDVPRGTPEDAMVAIASRSTRSTNRGYQSLLAPRESPAVVAHRNRHAASDRGGFCHAPCPPRPRPSKQPGRRR